MKISLTPKNILGFIIVTVAFSLALMIVWNFRGNSPEEMLELLPKNIELSLKKIDYTETRAGVNRWNLIADSALRDASDGTTHIQNVYMTFYDEKGEKAGTLSANRGVIYPESKQVSILDDVVVQSVRGYTFYTDHLDYSEATRLLTTDALVRVASTQIELNGQGFSLDIDRQVYQVLANVKARFNGGMN